MVLLILLGVIVILIMLYELYLFVRIIIGDSKKVKKEDKKHINEKEQNT